MNWENLQKYVRKQYSQCGEEGVLEQIFKNVGTMNKISVEFGCRDGYSLSNTRFLVEKGWTCHMWDCAPAKTADVKEHFITAENINDILAQYDIPKNLDLLSIDIDGNDYWVWKALTWQPRVVVIEFNGAKSGKVTIPYDPNFKYNATDYYGASFDLMCALGLEKGYVPVCQLENLNLFFVRAELVDKPPKIAFTPRPAHPPDPLKRPWQVVE